MLGGGILDTRGDARCWGVILSTGAWDAWHWEECFMLGWGGRNVMLVGMLDAGVVKPDTEGMLGAGGMLGTGEGNTRCWVGVYPMLGGMLDAGGEAQCWGDAQPSAGDSVPPVPTLPHAGVPQEPFPPPHSPPTPSPETRHAGSYRLSFIPENGGCLQKTRGPAPQK